MDEKMTKKAKTVSIRTYKRNALKWMRQVALRILKDNGLTYDGTPIYRDCLNQLEQIAGLPTPSKGDPYSSPKWRMIRTLRVLSNRYDYVNTEFLNGFPDVKKKRNRDARTLGPVNRQITAFYASYEWRRIRYKVLKEHGRVCMLCGNLDGPFHVDHIKPLRHNWHLRLDFDNLQVLCEECNHGKGNWDTTDWRPPAQKIERLFCKRTGQ